MHSLRLWDGSWWFCFLAFLLSGWLCAARTEEGRPSRIDAASQGSRLPDQIHAEQTSQTDRETHSVQNTPKISKDVFQESKKVNRLTLRWSFKYLKCWEALESVLESLISWQGDSASFQWDPFGMQTPLLTSAPSSGSEGTGFCSQTYPNISKHQVPWIWRLSKRSWERQIYLRTNSGFSPAKLARCNWY